MKKLFLLTAVALFGFTSLNAQTEKGSWMFGADTGVSFASSKAQGEFEGNEVGDETTISTFSFTPNANYFVMDNLAVGLGLSFSSSKTDFGDDDDYKTNAISVIPNATYFFKSESSVVPYLGAGAGLMSLSNGDDDIDKFSGLMIMARGGIAYFLSDSVSINFGVATIALMISSFLRFS